MGRRPLICIFTAHRTCQPASQPSPAQPSIQEESLSPHRLCSSCCPRCIHGLAHAGRIVLLPTAWVPPLPPPRLVRYHLLHCSNFPSHLKGLGLWTGMAVPPLPPAQYRDWAQIPGLRGRDEDGGATVSTCSVVYMRDDDDNDGEDTEQPREKETPASLPPPLAPTRTHTTVAVRQTVSQSGIFRSPNLLDCRPLEGSTPKSEPPTSAARRGTLTDRLTRDHRGSLPPPLIPP